MSLAGRAIYAQSWMSPSHKYSRCIFIYWHFPQHSEQSLSPFKEGICVGGKWLSAHSQVEMGIQSQANETTVTDTRGQSLTSRCVQRIITGMGSGRDRAGCRRMGNNHRGSSSLPCPSRLDLHNASAGPDTGPAKLQVLFCLTRGDAKPPEKPKCLWLPRNKGIIWCFLSNT